MQESGLGKDERRKGRSGMVTGIDRELLLALLACFPMVQASKPSLYRTIHLPVPPYTTNQNGGNWWRTDPGSSHEQGI